MRVGKQITKKVFEYDTFCDICGEKIDDTENTDLWYRDYIKSYDYGMDGKRDVTYHYDICEECMEKVVFPFLKDTIGKEPKIVDWEE